MLAPGFPRLTSRAAVPRRRSDRRHTAGTTARHRRPCSTTAQRAAVRGRGAQTQSDGSWCLAAISRAASPSGPGCGTNTVSR